MRLTILFVLTLFVACSQVSGPPPSPVPVAPVDVGVSPGKAHALGRAKRLRGGAPHAEPPPAADSRSTLQLAQAACSTPNGWACPAIKAPLKAGTATPIILPSWTVPHWYIDPSNATGCASDNNSGTSATCGTTGIGPLATWQELNTHRWGCFGVPTACPRNQQNTILSFLSAQTTPNDTIQTNPSIELGTYMAIECSLGGAQQSAAGTLNAVTAKARTSNTALHSTFTVTSGATAVGQLVVNTTRANSRAWIVTTGGLLTQPLSPITVPVASAFFPTLTEVDTWAHGDNFVAYTPMTLYISSIMPSVTAIDNNVDNGFYVLNCTNAIDPTNTNGLGSGFSIGQDVSVLESNSQREISMMSQATTWDGVLNTFMSGTGSFTAARTDAGFNVIFGGGTIGTLDGGTAFMFDYDYVFSGSANEFNISYGDEANIATAYVDSTDFITAEPPGGVWSYAQSLGTASIYGPGLMKIQGPGNIMYGPGNNATQTFPIGVTGSGGGGLFIGTSATACSHSNASTDVISCGISITPTNLDAAQSGSAFGGNAFIPGRGSITVHQ